MCLCYGIDIEQVKPVCRRTQEHSLEVEILWDFPGKLFPAEMSVAGRPLVDGSLQVQVSAAPRRKRSNMLHLCATAKILTSKTVKPDDNAGPQVKVLVNNLQQLLLALVGRAVGEQGDGQRVGHSDCIRHLERAAEIFQCVTGNLIRVYLPLRPLYGRIHGAWTRTQQLTLNLFYLHQDPPAQSGLHQRLRHPACSIGG